MHRTERDEPGQHRRWRWFVRRYLFFHMTIEAETKTRGLVNSQDLHKLLKFFQKFLTQYLDLTTEVCP